MEKTLLVNTAGATPAARRISRGDWKFEVRAIWTIFVASESVICGTACRLTSVGEPMPSEFVVYLAVPSAVLRLILALSLSTQNA